MSMVPWDNGDDVEEVGNFEVGDLGNIPVHTKAWYERGAVIIVVGISDGEFTGQFDQPAKSLLHYLPEDNRNEIVHPWGLLIPIKSTAMNQAISQIEKSGGKPFYAFISKKVGKSFNYWLLEPVRQVWNQDGSVGGFRMKDGTMFSNSEMPEGKGKK